MSTEERLTEILTEYGIGRSTAPRLAAVLVAAGVGFVDEVYGLYTKMYGKWLVEAHPWCECKEGPYFGAQLLGTPLRCERCGRDETMPPIALECHACATAHPDHGCADVSCLHNCQAVIDSQKCECHPADDDSAHCQRPAATPARDDEKSPTCSHCGGVGHTIGAHF